jgi:hypothetical protein
MVANCCHFFSLVSDVGISTATVLVRVTEDLRSAKAEEKVTVHVLLKFFKAFDLMNHGLFVNKLDSWYDFQTSAIGTWFHPRVKSAPR